MLEKTKKVDINPEDVEELSNYIDKKLTQEQISVSFAIQLLSIYPDNALPKSKLLIKKIKKSNS